MVEKRRILVIDDDRSLWEAYKLVLSPRQEHVSSQKIAALLFDDSSHKKFSLPVFDLDFAPQGRDGLALVVKALEEGNPYCVAFVDVRMPPGWDGASTASKIREIDPNIEIVIVTAYSDKSREDLVKAAGGPEKLLLLRKPFDPEELTQIALCLSEKWILGKKEAQQRLDLETILSATPAAIFTLDENAFISSWNPSAKRITGYNAEDALGRPCIFSLISTGVICAACSGKDIRRIDGFSCPSEIEVVDKHGAVKTVVLSTASLNGSNSKVSKTVMSFWDVTDRKSIEAALQESEARFRALVETTSDLVWETDSTGRYTYCSPVVEQIYGSKPAELIGQQISKTLLHIEETEYFEEAFNLCVKNIRGFKGLERRGQRKDGKEIVVESSGTPTIGQNGQLLGFRGIDRDITERKKAEDEKLKLQEQQRRSQKLDALGTMAGGIAHDLNNILTPILGYSSICLAKINRDSVGYREVQAIERAAGKAKALIRQILAFSRRQTLVPTNLNLNELINEFSQVLHSLIREDINMEFDLQSDLWSTTGDSGQIEQILINLVVNAKDAIVDGGQIIIKTRNKFISDGLLLDMEQIPISGEFIVFSVSDNGKGMDQKTIDKVLDPFFTTKEVDKGTGIGLSTVYGIVKQHGGHLRVESEKGFGTTFSVFMKKSKFQAETESKSEDVFVKGGNETILLVEDNFDARKSISIALESFGYNIIEACNGNDAIEKHNKHEGKINLLLTDVVMPELGGKALAQRLRARDPKFPVIFMSGYAFGEIPLELIERRDAAFIHKPFKPAEIALKIRQTLDNESPIQSDSFNSPQMV